MNTYIQRAVEELDSTTSGLSDAELIRLRPVHGKWSAAEVLEHLTLAFTSTTRLMRKVIAEPRAIPPPTLRQRLKQLVVVGAGYFPSGVQAPEFTKPTGAPLEGIRTRCREALVEMDAALAECERSRKIAAHPILGPFDVQQWCKFHFVHTRHHMKQIRRMRKQAASAVAPGG